MSEITMIRGTEQESLSPVRTQVYLATHKGDNYLHYMKRSFISFSYGGRLIEDFGLIATVSGDRMVRDAYATFDDEVSTYAAFSGQFYWGTYYRNNSITFHLATDAITQRLLDEFRHWFLAGKIRELILAEHPNRVIMARVSAPPVFNLLPFESPIKVHLNRSYYSTSTTLYKGEIELTMVMDDPFWRAKINIFGQRDSQGIYRDTWFDISSGRMRNVLENPDALKILYEDGIPLSSMITSSMLLGQNIFASVNYQLISKIIKIINEDEYNIHSGDAGYFNNGTNYGLIDADEAPAPFYKGAVIATVDSENNYISGARIAGAIMSDDDNGIESLPPFLGARPNETTINFYYAGTAPSPVTLKFTLYPDFYGQYIKSPANNYTNSFLTDVTDPYNTITIEGKEEKHEFKITTPNIYTSYNQIIRIFDDPAIINPGLSWAKVRELIRETVWHPEVRAWANSVIDSYDLEDGQGTINISTAWERTELKRKMQYFLQDANGNPYTADFVFNAKTGEAIGTIRHRSSVGQSAFRDSNTTWPLYCASNVIAAKENVGDMVKSKYLFIEERNYPNDSNNIVAWEEGQDYSHRLYHNIQTGITNISIEYLNLYF